MFAIKLLMEKRIKKIWAAGFSDLPAINATVFTSEYFFTQMSFLPQKVELFGLLTLARADTSNIPQLSQIILNCF